MTSIILSLDLIKFSPDPDDLAQVRCPGCHGALRVHRPDDLRPERLLGTCPSCSASYLIDADAAVMCRLPDPDELRDA